MRFSLRLNNDLRLRDYVALAQVAEEMGFAQLWVSNDLFLRSASVILPAVFPRRSVRYSAKFIYTWPSSFIR